LTICNEEYTNLKHLETHIQALTYRGLPALQMQTSAGDRATVALHGGHLLSWIPAGSVEQLYVSPDSSFEAGKAIRGGTPVIFPQFSARGPFMRHGFARMRPWKLQSHETQKDATAMTLRLTDDDATRALWPHAFCCDILFTLERHCLTMQVTIENTGTQSFSFTTALHTYFEVGNLASVTVQGLQDRTFEDTGQTGIQTEAILRPPTALDRIYWDTPSRLGLNSASGCLELCSSGFTDTVVWNPGHCEMNDLPQCDRGRFLCIEAALIQQPAHLAPHAQWQGRHSWKLTC
jgi:glucose-6-phosphate 1-epimerase